MSIFCVFSLKNDLSVHHAQYYMGVYQKIYFYGIPISQVVTYGPPWAGLII
jgi:hypothetical protein